MSLPRFLRRFPKAALALLIIIAFTIVIAYTASERSDITPVEKILRETLAPVQEGVTGAVSTVANYRDMIFLYSNIQQENEILRQRILELTRENDRMQEYRHENIRLREIIDFEERHREEWEMEPTHVIARDYSNWYNSVTIDKGSRQGIEKNMPVVNHQGLVGRIYNVTPNTSEVLLIVDTESAVGGLVQLTRVPGIIEAAVDGENKLQLVHVPHDEPLPRNSVVVTSGLGGIFPKGIRIGYISEVKLAPGGLVQNATITPFVNFESLEELLIIKEWQSASDPLEGEEV